MTAVEVKPGASPLILGFPHTGTEVPRAVRERLNDNGLRLADTDWHIHRLYEGLLPEVTTVRAAFHRYVIDANRDPAGGSLYPGQNTTDLVPATDFDGQPIWREGQEPTGADVAVRVAEFHVPYHAALAAELERVLAIHSVAVLYDCHSIRSRIPFLFEGTLPDFSIGTDSGRSCSREIEAAAVEVAQKAGEYTSVLNGRFKGGWTTRHYGRPERGVHAIQMELAQSTYLSTESSPFDYDRAKAEKLRMHLKTILERIDRIARGLKTGGTIL